MPDRVTELFAEVIAATARGETVAMATVVETSRSVPRHASSRMIVYPDGSQFGTIGGGEMEARVITTALGCIANGRPTLAQYDLVDPSSGDAGVCGGTVNIYVEAFMAEATIFIVGCGHVGRAVADLAHWLGYRVVATDDRADLATAELVPSADLVVGGSIEEALVASPITANTDVVVVTRNVQVDLDILPKLLDSDPRSIGVMGSSRRWATTRAKLVEAGVDEERTNAVTAPIGLELNAETPAEIALSIMSQLVLSRRGQVEDS